MNKKKIAVILSTVLIAGVLGFSIYKSASTIKPVEVKSSTATTGDIYDFLSTTGVVKSNNVKEYYGTQAKIKKVNVELGDAVKKGDVLIELDIDDMSSAIKQSELQYENALLGKKTLEDSDKQIKSKLAEINSKISDIDKEIESLESIVGENPLAAEQIAKLNLERNSLVQTKQSITPISQNQYRQAELAISSAKSSLDNIKKNANKIESKIVATSDGIVTSLFAVEGSISNGMQPLVVVQDLNDLKLNVSISKYDANKIKLGQQANVLVNDKTLKGEVSFINPTAVTTTSPTGIETTLPIEIDLIDFDESLLVEFSEDVEILLNSKENIVKVPSEAVRFEKNGQAFVFVINEDNTVSKKEISVGLQSDLEIEVLNGISNGATVILNPNDTIKDGLLVSTTPGGRG